MECPTCGQEYNPNPAIPYSNVMNHYVDAKTGKLDGVYNLDKDIVELPDGRKLIRLDERTGKPVQVPVDSKPALVTAPPKVQQTAPTGKAVIEAQPEIK